MTSWCFVSTSTQRHYIASALMPCHLHAITSIISPLDRVMLKEMCLYIKPILIGKCAFAVQMRQWPFVWRTVDVDSTWQRRSLVDWTSNTCWFCRILHVFIEFDIAVCRARSTRIVESVSGATSIRRYSDVPLTLFYTVTHLHVFRIVLSTRWCLNIKSQFCIHWDEGCLAVMFVTWRWSLILYMISITGATDGLVQIGFYLVGMKNGVASCAINRAKIFEVDAMLFGDRQFFIYAPLEKARFVCGYWFELKSVSYKQLTILVQWDNGITF